MINPKYLTQNLKVQFMNNKPFPHLVLPEFFNSKTLTKVLAELTKEEFHIKNSDLFTLHQTSSLSHTHNPILKEFYNFLNSKEFKEFIYNNTGIKAFGEIDCYGFQYKDTNYLLPHDDSSEDRKIAYVVNLSKNLTSESGGSLQFFKKDQIVKTITPEFNTFVMFQVIPGKTYHQVTEILENKERYTISGWFNA